MDSGCSCHLFVPRCEQLDASYWPLERPSGFRPTGESVLGCQITLRRSRGSLATDASIKGTQEKETTVGSGSRHLCTGSKQVAARTFCQRALAKCASRWNEPYRSTRRTVSPLMILRAWQRPTHKRVPLGAL